MEIQSLQNQLHIARNEINKLRQQVRNLQHVQRINIETVKSSLRNFRCENCRPLTKETSNLQTSIPTTDQQTPNVCNETQNTFSPIGVIRTMFAQKRAVPRQSSVGGHLRGVVEISRNAFTNPEHALEGLQEYSHMWLIYHFHKNNPHPKAKVAPPRLGGLRVGVLSTRSPHRPCPIGLSLVKIDKIEGSSVYFFGTDVVDGTPVLDIKPYIPIYDAPVMDSGTDLNIMHQEPKNEESELELTRFKCNPVLPLLSMRTQAVKVPNWIVSSHQLTVLFNGRAERQLLALGIEKNCITDILVADPRSVYLRTKYGSQVFTFQLGQFTVTCKFDDKATTVTVLQVRQSEVESRKPAESIAALKHMPEPQ